ncbi:hypothetical protein D3C84_1186470 [compost metagenome]
MVVEFFRGFFGGDAIEKLQLANRGIDAVGRLNFSRNSCGHLVFCLLGGWCLTYGKQQGCSKQGVDKRGLVLHESVL